MTGREKVEAAFTASGSPQIAAAICYEGIYTRDHWRTVTDCPWWWAFSPRLDRQLEWHRQAYERSGMDWFHLRLSYSRDDRERLYLEEHDGGVWLHDTDSGSARNIEEPRVAGALLEPHHPARLADTTDELDRLVPIRGSVDPGELVTDGRADLARGMVAAFPHLFPICSVSSPLWSAYEVWGFEGMMEMIVTRPDLVEYVCALELENVRRQVREAAVIGAAGIWIEECFTDMIGPAAFERLNLPFLREVVAEIRAADMRSIYYYCGNPSGKWDLLLAAGADALSLEESKKGWLVDIEDVVRRVDGRCVVLGNLDAIDLLANGSDRALAGEVARQIAAGRRNSSRFIMSIGSPVTPGTSVARVRRYCDLVRQLGS